MSHLDSELWSPQRGMISPWRPQWKISVSITGCQRMQIFLSALKEVSMVPVRHQTVFCEIVSCCESRTFYSSDSYMPNGSLQMPKIRGWAKIFHLSWLRLAMTWLQEGATQFHQVSIAVYSAALKASNSAKIKFSEQLHEKHYCAIFFLHSATKILKFPKVCPVIF